MTGCSRNTEAPRTRLYTAAHVRYRSTIQSNRERSYVTLLPSIVDPDMVLGGDEHVWDEVTLVCQYWLYQETTGRSQQASCPYNRLVIAES